MVVLVRAEDYLFTGTVAGNIRLADPDASDTDVIGLLDAVALDPAGLEPRRRSASAAATSREGSSDASTSRVPSPRVRTCC